MLRKMKKWEFFALVVMQNQKRKILQKQLEVMEKLLIMMYMTIRRDIINIIIR